MTDVAGTTVHEQLQLANRELASTPFYIGTTRRKIAGLGLAVNFNLEQGTIVGSIAADLTGQSHQPGEQHPLATTAVTILGDDRQRVVNVGNLDEIGRYVIPRLQPQLRYYLHFGAE
jgi:hypothetical protein